MTANTIADRDAAFDRRDGAVAVDTLVFENQTLLATGWIWFGVPAQCIRLFSVRTGRLVHEFTNHRLPGPFIVDEAGRVASDSRFVERILLPPGVDAADIAFGVLLVMLEDGSERRVPFTDLERDLAPLPRSLLHRPRLGIGITTYNRRPLLERVLDAVAEHTTEPYDLLVADDGSSDDTVGVLRARGVPHIAGPNRGVAWNKNRVLYYLAAIRSCDVLIVLEDDTAPATDSWQHDWIAASLAYGHVNFKAPWFGEPPLSGGASWQNPARSRPFSGQCVGFSRHALLTAGYMDARFTGYGLEHVEHTRRLERHGFGCGAIDPADPTRRLIYLIDGGVQVFDTPSHGTTELVWANHFTYEGALLDLSYREAWHTPEQKEIMLAEMESVAAA